MDQRGVLVGTRSGIHSVGAEEPPMLAGQSIDHLLTGPGGRWAISDGATMWRHSGGDWRAVAKITDNRAHCVVAVGDRILVGASEASVLELVDGELRRMGSFDEAPGRDAWYTPWGGPPDVRSVARGGDGTLYVNVHVGGVVRSTDDGLTWADTLDIHSDVHQVVTDPERSGHAYAASALGLAVTTDRGDTWQFHDQGLHASYCRAVAVSAGHVFVSASLGPGGQRSAIYRRPLDGGVFERCAEGLPEWFSDNVNTFCLAAGDRFVVAGDVGGSIYESLDEGETWQVAAEGLVGVRCLALA